MLIAHSAIMCCLLADIGKLSELMEIYWFPLATWSDGSLSLSEPLCISSAHSSVLEDSTIERGDVGNGTF